jgi:UDP-N-acetylmuramoyl-tripeptide--D-alanyl-D-alanine ligase
MKCPVTLFGTTEGCEYRAENIHIEDGKNCFTLRYPEGQEEVVIKQLGLHNVQNALVAVAVARHFGIEPSKAKEGLYNYEGIAMRQQINHLARGIKVIDDTYNASPASVKSGVDVLMQLDNPGRKIAVLGDILELGDISWQCHYDTGKAIATRNLQLIVTVGQEMKALAKAVVDAGTGIAVCSFDTNEAAIEWLLEQVSDGDAILVKGSRGMHEEEVVKALREKYSV